MKPKDACAAFFLAFTAPFTGAEELVSDPDQTESAEVVPRGALELELAWMFARDERGGVREEEHEAPETLIRIGLAKRVELQLGWNGYQRSEVSGTERSVSDGVGDAELGLKLAVHDSESGPQVALQVSTSLPVGDGEVSSDGYDPELRLAIAHELHDGISLSYNLGAARESEPEGDEEELAFATIALGRDFTPTLGVFVELFGETPLDSEDEEEGDEGGERETALSIGAGLTWLMVESLQLDLAAGLGLNDAATDWFFTLGITWSFSE